MGLRLLLHKTCPQLAFVNIDSSASYLTMSTFTVMYGYFQLIIIDFLFVKRNIIIQIRVPPKGKAHLPW